MSLMCEYSRRVSVTMSSAESGQQTLLLLDDLEKIKFPVVTVTYNILFKLFIFWDEKYNGCVNKDIPLLHQVGTRGFASRYNATYVSWAFAYLLGLICLIRACYWGAIKVSYPENSFA